MMRVKYDVRCKTCKHLYEYEGPSEKAPGECPECGSDDTMIVWVSGFPAIDKAKDPYDYLDGKGSKPSKKIVSGPKYSSKTTV